VLALTLVVGVGSALGAAALLAFSVGPATACSVGTGRGFVVIPQGQMEPTLLSGDVAGVVAVSFSGLRRGDIVAIDWHAWTGDPAPNTVERVIGLPGDHVELRDGAIFVNGLPLAEPYLPVQGVTRPDPALPAMTTSPTEWDVPARAVFVLGDSRTAAADSRSYGMVPASAILGRATYRCGPSDRRGPIAARADTGA
jgi:signal peptidase I